MYFQVFIFYSFLYEWRLLYHEDWCTLFPDVIWWEIPSIFIPSKNKNIWLKSRWSAWLGSQTLWTSHRTSQVRKIVHNFHYTKSNFVREVHKNSHILLHKTVLKFLLVSLQFSRLPGTTEVCTQSRRIFRFFFSWSR